MDGENLKHEIEVRAPAAHAFSVFVDEMSGWWPFAYTVSKDALAKLTVSGRRIPWGAVAAFTPETHLGLTRTGSDGHPLSNISIWFRPRSAKLTQVELQHQAACAHSIAEDGDPLSQPSAWPAILREYAEAASPTSRALLNA